MGFAIVKKYKKERQCMFVHFEEKIKNRYVHMQTRIQISTQNNLLCSPVLTLRNS
jgi:hypothetical protein